jgi:GH15 family glucan-1,4-alpha-glucosidase
LCNRLSLQGEALTVATTSRASLDLGLIGNCQISALVDQTARVVWCCLPRFDGDAVFQALLCEANGASPEGAFSIELEDFARGEQHYEVNTAILHTRLYDSHEQGVEVIDFMPRYWASGRPFRPAMLVRSARPIAGNPRITVRVRPRFDWGRSVPNITRGSNHVRYVADAHNDHAMTLRLTTNAPLSHVLSETSFSLAAPISFLLGADESIDGAVEAVARELAERTALYWRTWTRALSVPLEWQDAVIRAAITLKLCLFEDTGAIVAAMTTSIPEAANSGRNWDYRFCWLRDAFFTVRALNSLSEVGTLEDYLRWLHDVVRGAVDADGKCRHIQPLYGIGLEQALPERTLDHLSGYRGMGPVRIGNQAHEHIQHDVYGNIVLGAAQSFFDHRLFRRGTVADFQLLEAVGERAYAMYDQPDAGMWELRTRARVHTSSALMGWAACDRIAKIAGHLQLVSRADFWRTRADTMRTRILGEAWSAKRRAYAESLGGNDLDASVLLLAEVGMVDVRSPRSVATVAALEHALCDGPYMRRYEAPDDFGKPETAFNLCAFWRIDALARIGRKSEAREIFAALLSSRNHLGLLSEDTDPRTHELWGNFPQTYSMAGIINGAVRLSAPWDSVV